MLFKQRVAGWVQQWRPLRWGLRLGVRLWVPRHYVGAVGAVFNDTGQVLLVEHVFRLNYPWGLPGGWLEANEDPAEAVRRELREELNLTVEVRELLLCERQAPSWHNTPPGLGLAYYCRVIDGEKGLEKFTRSNKAYEVLTVEWVNPDQVNYKLLPIQRKAIRLGQQAFERDRRSTSAGRL